MNDRVRLGKLIAIAIGAIHVAGRVISYRRAVRAGTAARDPRYARAGRLAAGAIILLVSGAILLPMRMERGWPLWLFYPMFAAMIIGVALGYRAGFLFFRADRDFTASDRGD